MGFPKDKKGSLTFFFSSCFLLIFHILDKNLIEAAKHGDLDYSCDVVLAFGVAHSYVT